MAPTNKTCMAFNIGFKVSAADEQKVDNVWERHEKFMKTTHKTDGEEEPRVLVYYIMKAPVLNDFTDPSKGTTGEFYYSMNEIYRSGAGLKAHMAVAQEKGPEMLGEVMALNNVAPGFAGQVIHCFNDPMEDAWKFINKDCYGFQISMAVPNSEVGPVEQFLSDHEKFMNETHETSGNGPLRTLTYTATKSPIMVDPMDESKGATDSTLYTVCELYQNKEGTEAHMKAGQGKPELFGKFVELVTKYQVMSSMHGKVIACM